MTHDFLTKPIDSDLLRKYRRCEIWTFAKREKWSCEWNEVLAPPSGQTFVFRANWTDSDYVRVREGII